MSLLLVAGVMLGIAALLQEEESRKEQDDSYGANPCLKWIDLLRQSGEFTEKELDDYYLVYSDTDPDVEDVCAEQVDIIQHSPSGQAVQAKLDTTGGKRRRV